MEKKRHGAAGKMAVGLSALAVAALAAVGYHFSYPIDAGMDHFAAEADRWLRRDRRRRMNMISRCTIRSRWGL